jgi:hypothetical protein
VRDGGHGSRRIPLYILVYIFPLLPVWTIRLVEEVPSILQGDGSLTLDQKKDTLLTAGGVEPRASVVF